MELDKDMQKQVLEEFGERIYFNYNNFKKIWQCIAEDKDETYVLFYVCRPDNSYRDINQEDIQRIRDALIRNENQKAIRIKEFEEASKKEKQRIISSKPKNSGAVLEVAHDLEVNPFMKRAFHLDNARDTKTSIMSLPGGALKLIKKLW